MAWLNIFSSPKPDHYTKYEDGNQSDGDNASGVDHTKDTHDSSRDGKGCGADLHLNELRDLFEEKITIWHGLLYVLAYMAVGVVAYSYAFEEWGVTDSLYFSMVTFTTVGYGDVVPVTQWGRFFTVFYALSGIAIIGAIIGKIGEQVADAQVKAIRDMDKKVEDNTMDLMQGSSALSSLKKSLKAVAPRGTFQTIWLPHLPLLIPFLLGAYIEGRDQDWSFVDLLYYTVCTITTVGYGDLAPDDPVSRTVAVFFVPMSACALASILSRYAALAAERRLVEAQQSIVHRGLRISDLDVMDKDGDGEVSRLEFLEFMLLSMDRVDRGLLDRLHAQFDKLDKDGSGSLDRRDLVAKIQASEESRQKPETHDNNRRLSSYESPSPV